MELTGRIVGRVVDNRGEIHPGEYAEGECSLPLRFILGRNTSGDGLLPGERITLTGQWSRSRSLFSPEPIRSGYLRVGSVDKAGDGGSAWPDLGGLGGWVQRRLGELFPNEGPLVEALVLSRKERLPPSVREAYARAGTAHLLAISGFHVGVVGGLLLLAGGMLGLSHPMRFLVGSMGVWGYVLFIGLPDAALRAALILTLLAGGRFQNRAVAPLGALASAFILFLLIDPGAFLRPGFQLSFAGAFGLVAWSGPMARSLSSRGGVRLSPTLASAVAAGVSATLATLPLVVWHFGRVSIVGIPLTLLAAPMVALAIPGILFSLLLSLVHPALGAFLAMGVEADLWILSRMVEWAANLPLASVWVSRPGLIAGLVGVGAGALLLKVRSRMARGGRVSVLLVGALSGLLLWPPVGRILSRGTMEIVVLDIGQGDAILLRSPLGRWILVDSGPRTESFDAGARAILPYLRRRGVGSLEAIALTHPDMDHVGGAAAVLRELPVRRILDPGYAVGSAVFIDVLEEARDGSVMWNVVQAGDSLNLDGLALRVLWPHPWPDDPEDNNAVSLIIEIRYGEFSALLTGDAPISAEQGILDELLSDRIQVLKVGHHGSRTSTAREFLERIRPEAAVISVGWRNRFGHPHPEVLERLKESGAQIYRTDLMGTLIVKATRDGAFRISRSAPD